MRPVHPHASGEHDEAQHTTSILSGSSPREWGIHFLFGLRLLGWRFIPTRVGNTRRWSACCAVRTVHPHASGEHHQACEMPPKNSGSSPREWGTQFNLAGAGARQRFIPTRVGNTRWRRRASASVPVHPHASGEHAGVLRPASSQAGSSPREWGTRCRPRLARPLRRFIPTRVGNTPHRPGTVASNTVHPHASGEHSGLHRRSQIRCGSSPREWGTPPRCRHGSFPARFIPTRVGNTK